MSQHKEPVGQEDCTQALGKSVEQSVVMDANKKVEWENLPESHRNAWLQQVLNFYPPNTVSPLQAAELAREEYQDSETLLPTPAGCESD